jgi:two-component system LytT family sensor kinase
MFVFYSINLIILPNFWERNYILLSISIFFCLLIYWINYHFIVCNIIQIFNIPSNYQIKSLQYFLSNTFYYFVIDGSAGFASFFSRYSIYKLKQQIEKERYLIKKELYLLKNPFNSNLTFNFLSYCYKKTNNILPEVAESIDLFSYMLKYTIQTKPDEKVPLNNEKIYIENFIKLQKLLSTKVFVNFSYEGEIANSSILPRILITFVENAFKHGIYNDPLYPISIYLKIDDKKVIFNIKNRTQLNKSVISSNTGLENVTQILEIYYYDNYKLNYKCNENNYQVTLILNL